MTLNEEASFNCTAIGVGELAIQWEVDGVVYVNETCIVSGNCSIIDSRNNNGSKTSRLIILTSEMSPVSNMTLLSIVCIVNQSLESLSMASDKSLMVKVRVPTTRLQRSRKVQLCISSVSGLNQMIINNALICQ